jgi:hypothetical protein
MKNKLLLVFFAIMLSLTSCKNNKTEVSTEPEIKENKSFIVSMNLVVTKDDNFQIYYNEDGSDVFTAGKYVDVAVKGNVNSQDIIFKLPEDILPTSLRFDLGGNKEQGEVKINDFKLNYSDKTFVAKDTLFVYYFVKNTQVDYDRKLAIAKPKVSSNEIYDPIFTGTNLLKEEIHKLTK